MPVRPFEIVYNASEPYKSDVVIDSAEDGLRVLILLTMIDFYDVNRVALKYGRVVIFGGDISATFMSVYNSYFLSYEGGCVKFPIPEEYRDLYQDDTELPMEFPNGSTPAATGFMVFMGGDYRSVGIPAPTKSATIAGGLVSEYFHNYPHLGIDILYDSLHHASKVILKTNALGHPDFGAYHKCNFRLSFQASSALQKSGVKKKRSSEITAQTPWKDIRELFGGVADLRPVIHDSGLGLHPFGSSLCYSPTPGCIFEVMKSGFIASVTLTSAST
ncbi:hypothetical protein BBJ28_00018208 [Nothophytophthora sp. Chile5]|nr:hypothetical protein BBJ28_00018208 [Nothophytophthora sp. Chile5]